MSMLIRVLAGGIVALAVTAVLTTTVRGNGARYTITVAVDDTTQGDLDVMSASLETTPPGAEVQRSWRRLATSAAGEMALLADQRLDAFGNLTLDDGSVVFLLPDDEVAVSMAGDAEAEYVSATGARVRAARRRVVLIRQPCAGTSCSMKPVAILITTNNGCRRVLLFSHPPVVGAC